MKYKELPSEKLIQKLIATSFESPSANRKVYDWCESVLSHIRFLENERIKLVKKYGSDNGDGNISVPKNQYRQFFSEFNKILEMDIESEIEDCPVKKEWIDDEKCSYPKEKELWISAKEIELLTNKEGK